MSLPETDKETEWVHVQTLTKDQVFVCYVHLSKCVINITFSAFERGCTTIFGHKTDNLSHFDLKSKI
jgi:hypothetical protein